MNLTLRAFYSSKQKHTTTMQRLSHDIRKLLIEKYFTLEMKRNLLSVCKDYYWFLKPWLVVTTISPMYEYTKPITCPVCISTLCRGKTTKLMSAAIGSSVKDTWHVECKYGHITICHKKDREVFNARCARPNCNALIKQKKRKRSARYEKLKERYEREFNINL